jgi:hypothetical protein
VRSGRHITPGRSRQDHQKGLRRKDPETLRRLLFIGMSGSCRPTDSIFCEEIRLDTTARTSKPDLKSLAAAPQKIIELESEQMYRMSPADVSTLQLAGAQKRFTDLVDQIPMLTRLASAQRIDSITRIEDLAPLLVPHSAYKGYPMSFLEKCQFSRLTRWLDGLTSYDLSGIDASRCASIDDWLDLLDSKTEIRVAHSTGTSGKLTFLPRSTQELPAMAAGWRRTFDRFANEPARLGAPLEVTPTLFLQYRYGAMALHRMLDAIEKYVYGGDASMVLAVNPGRFSADVASIAGRLRTADAKGELGKAQIAPELLARREEFLQDQRGAAARVNAFLDESVTRFAAKPVAILANPPMLFDIASAGLARGLENVFAKDSYIQAGGGLKGHKLPDDWQHTVLRFFGAERLSPGYGMSEVVASTSRNCPEGNYHLPPWMIAFQLNPTSGQQLPREGTHVGRLGLFDLNAQTYWGGFLSSDEVKLNWGNETPCACGRTGAYLYPEIRRYSEQEGGDDKISCAGVADAHEKALDFILRAV